MMPAGQQLSHQAPSSANGQSTAHDLFVLTDEQILEIEPEAPDAASVGQPFLAVQPQTEEIEHAKSSTDSSNGATPESGTQAIPQNAQAGMPVPPEPPPWLAAQMKDPWSGEEAKEFWNGVQQAQQEAAAYRAAFATPEDARALKELYPGGVNEARAAVSRARLLDDIDRAYFGAAGSTPEEASAARAQLATMMLREDPAAFREMVFAGLRALEEAEKGSSTSANSSNLPRLAQVFAANRPDAKSAVGATLGSPAPNLADLSTGGASSAPTVIAGPLAASAASGAAPFVGARHAVPASSSTPDAHVAAYAAFEKAANEDLERSVGAAIAHTIEQALPNLKGSNRGEGEGARHGVPLPDRLGAAVRQDVEAALKGDCQLGEQIAQILSARRFDNETRAQVVRLIDDRARQLVPSGARRVINDWTQTTLAAHRGNASRADAATSRREVEPVAAPGLPTGHAGVSPAASSQAAQTRPSADPHRNVSRSDARRLDYRKLSDEQILEL
ncbi:MAG TPA: hypothetical protein VI431_03055 [Candidatus Acidoferrum sp.]